MTRLRRWQRAERLGLNPPIEVLAVLMREDKKPNKDFQTAHMEKIMSSLAVGAVV
jgi:DNA polymerase delta subunit 4